MKFAAHAGQHVAQFLERGRHHLDRQEGDARAHDEPQGEEGTQDPARLHAGGRHDDEFGIAVQPVQGVDDGDEQRHGSDDGDQRRYRKPGDQEEDDEGLALGRDEVELTQGLRHPDRAREADQAGEKGPGRDPEYVALDLRHRISRRGPSAWRPWDASHGPSSCPPASCPSTDVDHSGALQFGRFRGGRIALRSPHQWVHRECRGGACSAARTNPDLRKA